MTIPFPGGEDKQNKVDVPMRAFTGGYYRNLMAMYNHLGVHYHRQKFRFEFWGHQAQLTEQNARPYFIHASDNHECPPPRPAGVGLLAYIIELMFVIGCFFWFTICCHVAPTREDDENLDTFLSKIWLPRRFVSRYLLPLMSAIATCSHQEMLQFPAKDVIQYRKLISGHHQYVVTGGVGAVQDILMRDLDMRLREQVVRIEPKHPVVEIVSERTDAVGGKTRMFETFDQVIVAVPPNVVAAIFQPARAQLARIPIRSLETIVHRAASAYQLTHTKHNADRILLKTSAMAGGWTEATHLRVDGIAVTSCPVLPLPAHYEVLARATFTRTLRTAESRRIVGNVLGTRNSDIRNTNESKSWRNGDNGVWVVGAWCFDGMVLLEGAVASAMHVAKAFGVEIPWEPTD